jgi:NmrA-like family
VTTDFWGTFYNPATLALLKDNQTLGEYCYRQELEQGKNVFDAASQVQTMEMIVVSSLPDAEKLSGGKYKGVYHWDGKARALAYLKEAYPGLAGKLSTIIMGSYMGNWLGDLKLRKVGFFLSSEVLMLLIIVTDGSRVSTWLGRLRHHAAAAN